jgi:hypothetical protein
MNEDGSSKSTVAKLKTEWALFWESIAGEDVPDEASVEAKANDAFHSGKLEILNVDQLRDITKALSQDRKRLHQKLESLNKEMDLNTAKLESLRMLGSPEEETVKRINELNDIGQILGNQLSRIDEKIHWTRLKKQELLDAQLEG